MSAESDFREYMQTLGAEEISFSEAIQRYDSLTVENVLRRTMAFVADANLFRALRAASYLEGTLRLTTIKQGGKKVVKKVAFEWDADSDKPLDAFLSEILLEHATKLKS